MDFSHLSYQDQQKMANLIQEKQVKDLMELYSGLVDSCVNDFTSKALSSKEDKCVTKCIDKFVKHSERVGIRFAEQNVLMTEQMQKNK
ncbi:protein transporter tim9 [Lobulomyces angularis]|nr:protein transporter tim9 [Lobulomyces angularis]